YRRTEATGIAAAVDQLVDGVMPVVVVAGLGAIPAAVLADQGIVVPEDAGVLSGDHHTLASEAGRPHLGRADAPAAPLDRVRFADGVFDLGDRLQAPTRSIMKDVRDIRARR